MLDHRAALLALREAEARATRAALAVGAGAIALLLFTLIREIAA